MTENRQPLCHFKWRLFFFLITIFEGLQCVWCMGSKSQKIFLTVDDSLSLPQRVGDAVNIVVDVVAGPGQVIHLRLQVPDDLRQVRV